jgi:hypothetical protein
VALRLRETCHGRSVFVIEIRSVGYVGGVMDELHKLDPIERELLMLRGLLPTRREAARESPPQPSTPSVRYQAPRSSTRRRDWARSTSGRRLNA